MVELEELEFKFEVESNPLRREPEPETEPEPEKSKGEGATKEPNGVTVELKVLEEFDEEIKRVGSDSREAGEANAGPELLKSVTPSEKFGEGPGSVVEDAIDRAEKPRPERALAAALENRLVEKGCPSRKEGLLLKAE